MAMMEQAMGGAHATEGPEAMEPVGLGPLNLAAAAPEREVLTPEQLADWLGLPLDERGRCPWVEKNTQARRIPGQFKAGRYWRYHKVEILKHVLANGQVLLEKGKG